MDGNTELLNFIHQNSEMGVDTLKQIIDITKNSSYIEFKEILNSQYEEYKSIYSEVDKLLSARNKTAKDISKFAKTSAYISINLQTLMDKSPSHISEMLIQGSTMGIIDATKRINDYWDAEPEILDLAKKLLSFEQDNVEEWKKFL